MFGINPGGVRAGDGESLQPNGYGEPGIPPYPDLWAGGQRSYSYRDGDINGDIAAYSDSNRDPHRALQHAHA